MTEPEASQSKDAQRLADAFVARQGLSRPDAEALAARIVAAYDDVRIAARRWADTGDMPATPEIAGETPASLASRLRPSQVFTGLLALRENPAIAQSVLHHPPIDDRQRRGRDWEDLVRQSLSGIAEVESVSEYPLGPDGRSRPDFMVTVGGRPVVIEAKSISGGERRLRAAIDQVERFVLVFRAHGGLVVVPELRDTDQPRPGYLAPVYVTDLEHLETSLHRLVEAEPATTDSA